MIVAETPDAYRFVTQPDHAALAGDFAEHWGADPFERPRPFAAVAMAAHAHDDGWHAYDRRPHLDDDGTPVTFTQLPAATWTDLYDRAIEQVAALDRYAGLLVSMHGTGLRRRRYGLSPSWPDTSAAFEAFVGRQEDRQRELLEALVDNGDEWVSRADAALLDGLHETGTATDGAESRLWTNYLLLQTWDTLSLACCTTVSPPGRDAIGNVPRADGTAVPLSLAAADPADVVVDPYPFDVEPLVVEVHARSVEKTAFDTEAALVEAFYEAERERLELGLQPAE